ncbi:hypothetical protein [Granulicella mallensis]|nr:hypothetical protein [Granulicella mallensis]
MQRLFSMFPAGRAGVALLLLRFAAATTLIVDGTANWASVTSLWVLIVFLLPAFSLIVGLLTPYGSMICCLIQLVVLFKTGGSNGFHLAMSILNGGTVALLGPGAYSIDARLFGRQLLILPSRK